jgi:uncharacterized sporulation protein YeaH/YhbH (DUF444 family)
MIFVDRRKTAKNKSAPNRQALLRRIKNAIRNASPNQIGASVTNVQNNSASWPSIFHPYKFYFERWMW